MFCRANPLRRIIVASRLVIYVSHRDLLSLFIPKSTLFSSVEEFFIGELVFADIMTRDESASLCTHISYKSLVDCVYLVVL